MPITGTNNADNLIGTAGDDVIDALGGNDIASGGAGNDTIDGGTGNDTLYGGDNNDAIDGGTGADALYGDDGDDTLDGGVGNDLIYGGLGTDTALYSVNSTGFVVYRDVAGYVLVKDTNGIALNGVLDPNGQGLDAVYDDVEQITFNDITINNATLAALVAGGEGWGTAATLTGNASNNLLNGTAGIDTIYGGGGHDNLYGFQANDFLYGDAGNDALNGGDGDDFLDGGLDNDNLSGNDGNDTIIGGEGNDTIYGGLGNDDIDAGNGNDKVFEGDGNDIIDGGAGIDIITYEQASAGVTVDLSDTLAQNTGGAGTDTISGFEQLTGSDFNDTLTGDAADNTIRGRDGIDVIGGADGNDKLYGDAGTDTINGGNGNDTIDGGDDDDNIMGDAGDDTITGGNGNDTLDGGADVDTVSYSTASSSVTVDLGNAGAQNTVGAGTDTLSSFENLTGSNYNDTLTGDNNDNTIQGGAGDDVITGNGGSDLLYGSAGNDTITGGDGGVVLDGGSGNDTLISGAGEDVLQGGSGDDLIDGGAGIDTVYYQSAFGGGVTVDLSISGAQNTVNAGMDDITGIENVVGSYYNDTITGDGSDNYLYGWNGNDTINGAGGDDGIEGADGDDTLSGGAGSDTVYYMFATAGVDVSLLLQGGAQNTIGAGTDTLTGFENIMGSDFNDTLTGDGNDNVIEGLNGDDVMVGGGGTDTAEYTYATAGVTVSLALAGAQDTLGAGVDTLSGFENLTGSDFDDTLQGDGGDNVLIGGLGVDTANYDNATAGVDVSLALAGAQDTVGAGIDTLGLTFENLTGSDFDDILEGNDGDNVLIGGLGTDFVSYENASAGVTVDLSIAVAQDTIGAGNDTLGVTFENLRGSAFNDTLTGDANDNVIEGGDLDDTIIGGGGSDTLRGENGDDTISGLDAPTLNLLTVINENFAASTGVFSYADDLFGGVDTLGYASGVRTTTDGSGGLGALEVTLGPATGAAQSNFSGGWTYTFNLTNDLSTVELDFSYRLLRSAQFEANEDAYIYVEIDDVKYGIAPNNYVLTHEGDGNGGASYDSGWLNVTLSIGSLLAGSHTIEIGQFLEGTTFTDEDSIARFDNIVLDGFELAVAGSEAPSMNILEGGDGNDTLYGADGDDTLDGGLGNDALYGFEGDDTLDGGDGNDIIYGGADTDTVTYATATSGVTVYMANTAAQDTIGAGIDTLSDIENIIGSDFNDTLEGTAGANTMDGGMGNDALTGGYGSDTINGEDGDDTLYALFAPVAATALDVHFNANSEGFTYTDGGFGGTDPGSNNASGTWINTDGNTTFGALEIYLDGQSNTTETNISGSWDLTFNVDPAMVNAQLEFSYRLWHSDRNDTNENVFAYVQVDGAYYGLGGNNYFDSAFGVGGTTDTGWVTVTLDLGALSSGNHDITIGILKDSKSRADEDSWIRIDDMTITDTTNDQAAINILHGNDGNDTLYGSDGTDTLYGDAGNDTLYSDSEVLITSYTLLSADFTGNNGGFTYADGGFGGSDPANADATGSNDAADGDSANGSLRIDIDGLDGTASTNISGNWSQTINAAVDLENVQLTFSYRHWHSANNDSGEDSQVYVQVDGVYYGVDGNNYISQALGIDGGIDTGWVQITLGIDNLSAGNHTITMGILQTAEDAANEDSYVKFDDLSMTGDEVSGTINVLEGGDDNDTLYGGAGLDTLNGGNGDDMVYSGSGSYVSKTVTLLSAHFGTGTQGFTYADGPVFGGNGDPATADVDEAYDTGDGDDANGSLEIYIDGQGASGGSSTNMDGAWSNTFTVTNDLITVTLSLSYRHWMDSSTDSGDNSEVYVQIDGVYYGIGGNNYVSQHLGANGGGASNDTGWVAITLDIADLTAGNHTITMGILQTAESSDSEDSYVRFDDITLVGNETNGTLTILNGQDGLDNLYGASGIDQFKFEMASAFNNVDQIHNFETSGDDAIDLRDVLTGYTGIVTDFVQITTSGADSILSVDSNGLVGGTSWTQIGTIVGVTGLTDEAALVTSGNLIVS